MVLLSRSHVLERHGQDVIQVLTASWPAMRASANAFVLSTLSLVLQPLVYTRLRSEDFINSVSFDCADGRFRTRALGFAAFPTAIAATSFAAKDGVWRRGSVDKSATSVMLVRHLQVTTKELETREASRARASPTTTRARARRPPSGT